MYSIRTCASKFANLFKIIKSDLTTQTEKKSLHVGDFVVFFLLSILCSFKLNKEKKTQNATHRSFSNNDEYVNVSLFIFTFFFCRKANKYVSKR